MSLRDAIAGAIYAVLTHPDQLALVLNGEATWMDVFEEYCRWVAPICMSPRRVAQPHNYHGITFEPDERAHVYVRLGQPRRNLFFAAA